MRSVVSSFQLLVAVAVIIANAATVSSALVVLPKGERHTQPPVRHKARSHISSDSGVAMISAFTPTIPCRQIASPALLLAANVVDDDNNDINNKMQQQPFTHKDIVWKIRPPPEATRRERLKWKVSANVLRWECLLLQKPLPTVLCPNNFPQIVLEAHHVSSGQKMARFGISSRRGPSAPPIGATVEALYGIDPGFSVNLGIAAIVYMFVEPPFRGRHVGNLALEVIALIHATAVNADFTILVADDKSEDQRLVQWYETHGYARAPQLQAMMGSPDQQFGVSMIAPTNGTGVPEGCRIQWW